MQEFKGTPGPWVVDGDYDVTTEDGTIVSWTANGIFEPEEIIANAQLIAAAHDLLEALQDMLSGWKYIREQHGDLYGVGWDRSQNKAVKAINKVFSK